jgi:ABC-2 type transport system ATP-binding protein
MSEEKQIALEVKNLSKSFRLPSEKSSSLKNAFINRMKGIKGYKTQKVLKDISFQVHKGDFFGVVGRNGSGKSTLLKLISGIYTPDKGNIITNGSLVPFIELGVGFNPELTGRENVFLNGALLGFSTSEMEKMYDEIVDFAELKEFMGQKLKNYSSGMQVRLAFSIAIRAKSDILVLDEVLAVGDAAFQQKCNDYFKELKEEGRTVILVTHSMDSVRQYCNRAVLINRGRLEINGTPDEVANQYTKLNLEGGTITDTEQQLGLTQDIPLFKITPISPTVLTKEDRCEFEINVEVYSLNTPAILNIRINDDTSSMLLISDNTKVISKPGKYSFGYSFPIKSYNNIFFSVSANLIDKQTSAMKAFTNNMNSCRFAIQKPYNANKKGLIDKDGDLGGKWDNSHELS